MSVKINDPNIAEVHGQISKKDKKIYRYRNGKQQSYPKPDAPFVQTPARQHNQQLMSDASRITKEIMETPTLRQRYEYEFKAYNPDAHKGKRFENLRGYIFSQIFASLKQNI